MTENSVCYYCDASFKETDDEKWFFLLRKVLYDSDYVEFNVHKKDFDKIPEIDSISKHIIDTVKPKQKIYPRNKSISYQLNEDVIKFILSKQYMDWKNYYLEDISFFKNDLEIFATITHENYIIMHLNADEYIDLNNKGYNFTYFLPTKHSVYRK